MTGKRVLIHTCCGPCLTYPAARLAESGWDVVAYYFNPNIHPHSEYLKRLRQVESYCGYAGVRLEIGRYEIEEYFRRVAGHEGFGQRCALCYELRLAEAARRAVRDGLAAFTTTLLVSPHQDHELIRETGERAAHAHGTSFVYEDFRPGYRKGVERSKELGMYRQKYCGCLFSEVERSGGKS